MADPFVGEIRMFSFPFAPKGWAQCNGQELPARQNAALYALIGTTFGGTGNPNFNLPDLRGRTPVDDGQRAAADGVTTYPPGSKGGVETVTLNTAQIPAHTHQLYATATKGTTNNPSGMFPAFGDQNLPLYVDPQAAPPPVILPLAAGAIVAAPSGAHNNMQPYTVINFCIAQTGLFPPRN